MDNYYNAHAPALTVIICKHNCDTSPTLTSQFQQAIYTVHNLAVPTYNPFITIKLYNVKTSHRWAQSSMKIFPLVIKPNTTIPTPMPHDFCRHHCLIYNPLHNQYTNGSCIPPNGKDTKCSWLLFL